jgi:hypothetical protein
MDHHGIPLLRRFCVLLIPMMLSSGTSAGANPPQPSATSAERSDQRASAGVTTTIVTVTAPDGSESVYTRECPLESASVSTIATATICEGLYRGTNETQFSVVSQTLIDTFKVAFLNIGGCSKVTVRSFPVPISQNSFTISYDIPNVSSGSLTGTFSGGRENFSGTFAFNSLECGGSKSGSWVATPAVHCAAGPEIAVVPSSLTFSVQQGGSASDELKISNAGAPGSRDLFWYVSTREPTMGLSDGQALRVELRKGQRRDDRQGMTAQDKGGGYVSDAEGNIPGAVGATISAEGFEDCPASVSGLGDVVHSFPFAVTDLFGLEWVDGFLWATASADKILNKLDPIHGSVLDQIAVPDASRTSGLAWDGRSFWVTDATADVINKVDLSGSILTSFKAPAGGSVGLAWDGMYLWDVDFMSDELHKINPIDGSVLLTLPAPDSRPAGTAWDGKYLWVNGRDDATTYQLDPSDGSVVNSFATPPASGANNGQGAAFDGQYLWIVNYDVDRLYQIDIGREGGYAWLAGDPANGTLSAGASDIVSVTVDASGLAPGLHKGNLTIYSEDAAENPLTVPVTLAVGAVAVDDGPAIPTEYALGQNDPNPFNPSTTIDFALPHSGFVTLKVYTVLGEEVATLIAEEYPAGTFTTTWGASGLPSGVYFYRLSAGGYAETKMALLMR